MFYEVLNQNFINIVDTTAYLHGKLLISNNDSISNDDSISIEIDKNVLYDSTLFFSIKKLIAENGLKSFENALLKPLYDLKEIDLKEIKNTGRIIIEKGREDFYKSTSAGKIRFYTPYLLDNYCILTCSKAVSMKAGIVKVYFFHNVNSYWSFIGSYVIERW